MTIKESDIFMPWKKDAVVIKKAGDEEWAKSIFDVLALIEYDVAMFVDKYMKI